VCVNCRAGLQLNSGAYCISDYWRWQSTWISQLKASPGGGGGVAAAPGDIGLAVEHPVWLGVKDIFQC
jgi:hypothetical protein